MVRLGGTISEAARGVTAVMPATTAAVCLSVKYLPLTDLRLRTTDHTSMFSTNIEGHQINTQHRAYKIWISTNYLDRMNTLYGRSITRMLIIMSRREYITRTTLNHNTLQTTHHLNTPGSRIVIKYMGLFHVRDRDHSKWTSHRLGTIRCLWDRARVECASASSSLLYTDMVCLNHVTIHICHWHLSYL